MPPSWMQITGLYNAKLAEELGELAPVLSELCKKREV